jgi:predicted metal-dependent hydrolase
MTRRLMLEINGGTSVLMERSRRSRSVNIFVSPAGVRVAVPYWVSFAEAESIVRKRFGWIERNILRMEEFRRTYVPELLEMPTEKEAREKIENKLKCLAEEHGFSYNRLTIRRQKTRWGSCSHSNNISLNICLARLPADLMEYVILHELVHTRVKDHGRVFRRELDRLIGDSRGHEKRLKGYHLELLGSF